jgi:MoaA/NifB/PqqE/SkfB family radical SAM enzyme
MTKRVLVKIRQERKYFLTYFIEIRRIIGVDKVGAQVVNYFFNQNLDLGEIAKKTNYAKEEIKKFLLKIKKELLLPSNGGYPIIENEQMVAPIAAEVQINNQCNLRCKHCCQDDYNKIMPFKEVAKILKILHKAKVFEINLVGGEIFLHPAIFKILALCERYNFAVNLVTNATLINDSLIEKLSQFKNLALLISLEGVDGDNDKIRGNGVFQKVDKTIKRLKDRNIHFEISTTINAKNIFHYQKIIKYANSFGVSCNFNLFKLFKENQKKLVLKPEKYFKFVKNILNQRKKGTLVGLTNASIVAYFNKLKKRKECRATLSGLTIDVDGVMDPCPFLRLAGFYKNKDLPKFDSNFLKTWNSNKYFREFRQRNLKECQACAYIFNKNINSLNPYGLTAFKKWLRDEKKKRDR